VRWPWADLAAAKDAERRLDDAVGAVLDDSPTLFATR
jgi:hypothetical protein